MNKNKAVIKHCPNFYKISDFDFLEDDMLSAKLIDIYKDYIFASDLTNEEEVKKIKKIDYVLGKYIDDYLFRKEMQKDILNIRIKKSDNSIKDIVESIIDAFEMYESGYTRNIYFARWI